MCVLFCSNIPDFEVTVNGSSCPLTLTTLKDLQQTFNGLFQTVSFDHKRTKVSLDTKDSVILSEVYKQNEDHEESDEEEEEKEQTQDTKNKKKRRGKRAKK
jgi:hypothetical protein